MPITLYSFKLRRTLPLLSEDEYRPIADMIVAPILRMKEYIDKHGVSLSEARRHWCDEGIEYYERLTGVRLSSPEDLYWVRLSNYGRICPNCCNLFRSPRAKMCIECGLQLPPGELAGPAELPKGRDTC